MKKRNLRCFLPSLIFTFLLVSVSLSFSQSGDVNDLTATPVPGVGHDYLHMLNETVNPANGSVSVRIETPTPPGRRMTLPFAFGYDSSGAYYIPGGSESQGAKWAVTPKGYQSTSGWSNTIPIISDVAVDKPKTVNQVTTDCFYIVGYLFNDPHGSRHKISRNFPERNNPAPCPAVNYDDFVPGGGLGFGALYSTAGGPPIFATTPNGTVYAPGFPIGGLQGPEDPWLVGLIEDANGNTITIKPPGTNGVANVGGGFTVQDDMGRTLISSSGFGPTQNTVSIAGLSNPYTLSWTTTPMNFTTTVTRVSVPSPTVGSCGGPAGSTFADNTSGSLPVVSAITLPNGKQYSFAYDPTYGLLNQLTYPSGGWVKYQWGLNTQAWSITTTDSNGHPDCLSVNDRTALQHRTVSFDGVHEALQQDFSYVNSTPASVNGPLTSQTTVTTHDLIRGTTFQTIYDVGGNPLVEGTITSNDASGHTLLTVNKSWSTYDQLLCELHTLDNGQTSGVLYTYDGLSGELTTKKEYDFGLITPSTANCAAGGPTGVTPTRETDTTYQTFGNSPFFEGRTPRSPGQLWTPLLNRPCQVITYDKGTEIAETDYLYDGSTTVCGTAGTPSVAAVSPTPTGHDENLFGASATSQRGNGTTVIRKCLQAAPACASGNPTTTYSYDETGQVVSMVDPDGNAAGATPSQHTTTYSHTDSFSSGTPPGNTNAYVTKITPPATNGVTHIETFFYGYADGQLTQTLDENGQTTTFKYNDSLDRLTETDLPDGGQTRISYSDTAPTPSVTTSKKLDTTRSITSVAIADGVGHVTQTQLTSDPQGTDFTTTSYDGLGKAFTVTNPYRSTSDPTYGTTTYVYDALGRTTLVTKADGSKVQTAYCGPTTLVTDEAGHWRRSTTDGLGHLTEVDEPNSTSATVNVCPGTGESIWVTSYTYNALNDLLSVVQGGSRSRSFVYDSLKRMTGSNNPEAGQVCYGTVSNGVCQQNGYDANGNVIHKTDARSTTITYSYDALNRLTGRTYSNGDPAVTYSYDGTNCLGQSACDNVGQRTGVTDAAGTEAFAYDKMGRELAEQRTTNSVTKGTTYGYDLASDLTTLTYPSGRTITYTYDSAGRPSLAQDIANSLDYVEGTCANGTSTQGVCYGPQGGLASLIEGESSSFAGFNMSYVYSTRLQPCWMFATTGAALPASATCTTADPGPATILDLQYNFNLGAGDNGNVVGIVNKRDTTRTQSFSYDQVNRLLTAQTSATTGSNCWGEKFNYDQWANLLSISAASTAYNGCTQEALSVSATAQNQLVSFSYDVAGNVLNDGSVNYAWNAESEIKSAAGVNYSYDGDGNRVEKSNGKIYWYGAGTEILDETDLSGNLSSEYVFFGGERIARRDASNNLYFYVADMLGSSRAITTATGAVCYDADFYPFGGERIITNTCPQNYKFEGKERDAETGNDDFGARYYSSRVGRWLSADWSAVPAPVPYANLSNPQTLNLYAMVSDNPETFADLDGHSKIAATQSELLWMYAENCLAAPQNKQVCYDIIETLNSLIAEAERNEEKQQVQAQQKNNTNTPPQDQSAPQKQAQNTAAAVAPVGTAPLVLDKIIIVVETTAETVGATVADVVAGAVAGAALLFSDANGGNHSERDAEIAQQKRLEAKEKAEEAKAAAGGRGVHGGKKDRSLQGNADALDSITKKQATLRRRGQGEAIRDTTKSKQNVDNANKRIERLEDVENQ